LSDISHNNRAPIWCLPQLKIVLLGGRNSGKSSLGNLILGKEEFVTRERTSCSRRVGVVSGRRLTVVDTPGWWCDFSSRDTSELVKREIRSSVSLCPPGPHAFLVTVKVSSGFSERRRRAVEEHVGLLGEGVWGHCMVVFTLGDWLGGTTIERCVESEGPPLKGLLERCGNRYHVVNNRSRGDGFQVRELIRKMEEMLAGSADGPHFEDHLHLRTNESLLDRLSPRRPRMLLALPPSHPR
uniref:AIG1-type G domain-containing protein n=1 Tax=Tetraodon nigroviridis TaxID=99883 RepID=H3CF20_TETNG